MFTKENEWKFLVESLQKEIVKHDSDQELRLFFEQTMLGKKILLPIIKLIFVTFN